MNTKILLVDDEERILQTFARTLRLGGYSVITAEDGEEGLALYRQEQPDVILLDLRMPGMSGLEVLQAIREDDPEANVILCTAHGDKEAVIAALRAGCPGRKSHPSRWTAITSARARVAGCLWWRKRPMD
jgi:CheY-like chemotaxis protein